MFILAQVFGTIGLIILVLSLQNNNKKFLLGHRIFSSLFFALQYLCLNAVTGCLMNILTLTRNLIFNRFKNKIPVIYLILILVLMITLSILSFNGLISLLPTTAVIVFTIAIWQDNLRVTRLAEVISCSLFIIYNIKVLAISGLVSIIIELIFVLISIYRFDIKKQNLNIEG